MKYYVKNHNNIPCVTCTVPLFRSDGMRQRMAFSLFHPDTDFTYLFHELPVRIMEPVLNDQGITRHTQRLCNITCAARVQIGIFLQKLFKRFFSLWLLILLSRSSIIKNNATVFSPQFEKTLLLW